MSEELLSRLTLLATIALVVGVFAWRVLERRDDPPPPPPGWPPRL